MNNKIGKVVVWLAPVVFIIAAPSVAVNPPLPTAAPLKAAAPTTNVWFFAATCTDKSNLSSDYSAEVSLLDTNGTVRTVTLAWDKSQGTNVITNYTIWQGAVSRVYTNWLDVGTNLTGTIRVQPPLPNPPTNLIITVTGLRSASAGGPWQTVPGWTPIVLTNPPGTAFYRVGISAIMQ